MTEAEIIHRYNSNKAKHAVSFLWEKKTSKTERREHIAPAVYARKVKTSGEDAALQWLVSAFGYDRAMEMVISDRFTLIK